MQFPINEHAIQSELLFESRNESPGSFQYSIKRYARPKNWIADDVGIFSYHYQPLHHKDKYLELKFCSVGNLYCRKKETECNQCKAHASFRCEQKTESVDFLSFYFPSSSLNLFKETGKTNMLSQDVINFQHPVSFSKLFPVVNRARVILEALLNHKYTGHLANIFVCAQAQMLLLYSLDDFEEKQTEASSAKFLSNEADKEKLLKARDILLQHISEPITIKALSRKIAMNECYLKKGFKAMFGTTIFDFYQSQRMEHAKNLLYEKGLTVTDVSIQLGYSSISHFSIAFKKHTGLKPCDLLR